MSHKPDYLSPWGTPQSSEEMSTIHSRWINQLKLNYGRTSPPSVENEDWSIAQCGGCSYFIPLEGSIGADWGVCTNPLSNHDREATFEHFGCLKHSHAGVVVDRNS